MRLRSTLLFAALASAALAPVPALARDHSLSNAVRQLNDPQLQSTVASAMAALSEAMLSMKMAPFARAMEGMGKAAGDKDEMPAIDPDATLGDMMGPEAREMPDQMAEHIPQMMGAMAGMAGAMEGMLPQLEELGKRLKHQLPRR